MPHTLTGRTRLNLCRDSLDGLSVGDALGAQFFTVGPSHAALVAGDAPAGPWPWTDDTQMACSVVDEVLSGGVDQQRLAANFAERCDPYRGYGVGAVVILHRIREGTPWREAAGAVFNGAGSCGNGAAMRIAPLGAYHAGDPGRAAAEARLSAEVTHAHPAGIRGAVLVAVAAANAAAARMAGARPKPGAFLDALDRFVVPGEIAVGIQRARRMLGASVGEAAYTLGNGAQVTAQDTVPFALWVAARHLHDYPAAMAACVEAGGDIDTTCAIVGGIVAAYTGIGDRDGIGDNNGNGDRVAGVPRDWLDRREPLPDWLADPTAA